MILGALNDYYRRLKAFNDVPTFGYSVEKISYALIFSCEGNPIEIADLRDHTGKKPSPRAMRVPTNPEISRTSAVYANPMWDKTAYALGVTAGEGKRLQQEHAVFKARQHELFAEADDHVLSAFCRMLEYWTPNRLTTLPGYSDELLDTNIVFRLDGEHQYLHDRPVAQRIWQNALEAEAGAVGQCLVTGDTAPLAAGHPRIRDVDGAQSSGAALVSFNSNAYLSYGQDKDSSAAISKAAVFGYATALNHLLRRDRRNRHRLRIGDATVVFWAQADENRQAEAAEELFASLNDPPDDARENEQLRTLLDGVSKGRPLASLDPDLNEKTRFFVLGLAPNAARLSIRFWCTEDLGGMLQRYGAHRRDLWLEPAPWKGVVPAMWRLLYATAPSRGGKAKAEDISPVLAGEMTRAILTGSRYPRSLLANIVMRFRNDGDISGIRVALCKAVLSREARLSGRSTHAQEVPMSLDRSSTNPGYRLGRLFAELENAQLTALNSVNASIRDRYYGAASATPASVFPVLLRNVQHHLSNMRKKEKGGLAHRIESEMTAIIDGLGERFPKSLRIEDQGRFAIGYYHQRQSRFAKGDNGKENEIEQVIEGESE